MEEINLGAVMAVREFECLLCLRKFSQMSGDIIMPEDEICGRCFDKFSQLKESELQKRVTQQLAENALLRQGLDKAVTEAIQRYKKRGK